MKKLLSIVLLALAVFTFGTARPAFAAGDAAAGAQIFNAVCASCHLGGKNLVNPTKSLSSADLAKYGMNSIEAITKQVTNGKNGMPAFKGRLSEEKILNVATYVLEQSEKGWKK